MSIRAIDVFSAKPKLSEFLTVYELFRFRAARYVVWDTELKGFALWIAATGTKTYIIRYIGLVARTDVSASA